MVKTQIPMQKSSEELENYLYSEAKDFINSMSLLLDEAKNDPIKLSS